jgi:5-formyltetrahydrofolate cyclo-ligase
VKLDSLLERAVSDGKNVYIPKILDDDKTKVMRFYRYDGHFTKGSFGILEPQNVSETSMYPDMKEGVSDTLMIMPGVAFDINKNRLGYGGGFYDRYLQEHKEFDIYKAAVAFDMQVLDELPVDIYDIKADCIVTEKRIII